MIAVALSVLEISIDTAILVAGASSIDDSVARVADAAVSLGVPAAVKRAHLGGSAFSIDGGLTIVADTLAVDVGGPGRADGLTEALFFSVSGFAEASIGVGVIVLAGVAVGADSLDPDVLRFADAGLSGFGVVLIDAGARGDVAGLGELVVGLLGAALAANTIDDVVSLGAVALAAVEVVNLV